MLFGHRHALLSHAFGLSRGQTPNVRPAGRHWSGGPLAGVPIQPARPPIVGDRSAPNLRQYLPHVVAATLAVAVLPILLASCLVRAGLLNSALGSAALTIVASLGTSSAGSALWKARRRSHELVFSELMIWGWVRRQRAERRLSRATELLGKEPATSAREERVKLFEELATALESGDPYTHGHSRRVTRHAATIAERMGLSRELVDKVRTAAAIHDVGKINTPTAVLNKPGRLTDEEFAVIKRHPVEGAEMAVRLGDDEITAMVLHHHERLDGTGYPSGLVGDEIPLGARIIAVADTFDAITSTRAYRKANSHKKALAILTKESGTQLDPDAVRAFRSHYSGKRGVALWSLLTSAPQRLLPWLWTELSSAPLTKGIAALAVAGALGGSAAELARARRRVLVIGALPLASSPRARLGTAQETRARAHQRPCAAVATVVRGAGCRTATAIVAALRGATDQATGLPPVVSASHRLARAPVSPLARAARAQGKADLRPPRPYPARAGGAAARRRSPAAHRRCPAAHRRCPAAHRRCPAAHHRCPAARRQSPAERRHSPAELLPFRARPRCRAPGFRNSR